MTIQLQGKVALVTGASKGIGAEIARALATSGAAVAVNFSASADEAAAVVDAITSAGGRAVAVKANVTDEADVKRLFAETERALGPIDIVVNNAGMYRFAPIAKVTVELYRQIFDLNVLGTLLCAREAVGCFGDRAGTIINVGSVVSTASPAMASVYGASKSAVDGITRALAKELGPRKIRVNGVNPGVVDTEQARALKISGEGDKMQQVVLAKTPLGRLGMPADIAPAVVFLASDAAAWITGETLTIAGGFVA